uniref:Variable major protein n=1 Tax=Borrelia hermsii TaxID=140 RepID=P70896_BORHE|nr:variable major protein [Borrelia hermsii]
MKKNTLSAILMTLFLFISCNNGGPELKGNEVAKSDGTVLDLSKISSKIKNASAFAAGVKEIHALVKSVGEFAKGIGNKVTQNTGVIDADAGGNNNGQIIVGAYSLISGLKTQVEELGKKDGISDGLKEKLDDVSKKGTAFLDKVKADAELCKKDVTDENAKKALDVNNASKEKGAKELGDLNTAVDGLLTAANGEVEAAIKELTAAPAKPATPVKP